MDENTNKHKISVLMPVYNTEEKYLKEAIDSILNQTMDDFELLIADDGSENDIESIVKSYNDNRIKFFKLPHQGVAKVRNFLLDNAKSKYAAWIDSDDVSLPYRLETQYNYLEKNPNISICGGHIEKIYLNQNTVIEKYPLTLGFLEYYLLSQGTSMLRLEDINKFNLRYNENISIYEDPEFYSRAFRYLNCSNIDKILVKYRVLPNSLSHSSNRTTRKDRNGAKEIFHKNIIKFLTADKKLGLKIFKEFHKNSINWKQKIFSFKRAQYDGQKYRALALFGKVYLIEVK